MNRYNLIPKQLIDKSIDLSELGVNEVAWLFDDALEVISVLRKANVVILGGDVLNYTKGKRVSYALSAWHYDKADSLESVNDALTYIENWKRKYGDHFAYVLVF